MTTDEILNLHSGDDVFWEDPDEGICSRVVTIQAIEVIGDVVRITDSDGAELECFAEELS